MNSTLEHELTRYLRGEAARVEVRDNLELDGVPLIRIERSKATRTRGRATALIGVAASLVLLAGLVAIRHDTAEVRTPAGGPVRRRPNAGELRADESVARSRRAP